MEVHTARRISVTEWNVASANTVAQGACVRATLAAKAHNAKGYANPRSNAATANRIYATQSAPPTTTAMGICTVMVDSPCTANVFNFNNTTTRVTVVDIVAGVNTAAAPVGRRFPGHKTDQGSMSVWKNDVKLGAMAEGLSGPQAWG